MKVVVVESPAKAKTINNYLGPDYIVLASYGHIRDLPSKDGSVDTENDFEMIWEADAASTKRIREIAEAVKGSEKLILATDPDREGEAISWHIIEALKKRRVLKDVEIERVVFNAITKTAVTTAMGNPRQVDAELVDAYLARRALDYLVGFNLSPVLWRKLPGSRSAGRVQSVALRIICQRELEIELFKPQEYWQVQANLRAANGTDFQARLHTLDGERLQKFTLGNEEKAEAALQAVQTGGFSVTSVEAKPIKRNPPPPFITSTLQQEASRKLGYGAKRTMQAAQKLYEQGHITYMRTDGVQMAEEAYTAARDMIRSNYGAQYLPEKARRYASKAKNAQEAHEAIRPTRFDLNPKDYSGDSELKKLYTLVWRRAVACQMEAAKFERTTIDLTSKDKRAGLRATGQVLVFDGYIKLYTETLDEKDDADAEARLPKVHEDEHTDLIEAKKSQHFTEPPARFSEASLVKRLEELGIGRPSTYASTLATLEDRDYVRIDKKRLVPEDKGRLVTAFLENFFARYVEYDFTAGLEDKLDVISNGKLDWKTFLREFWTQFSADIDETKDLRVSAVLDALNETLGPHVFPSVDGDGKVRENPRQCPTCEEGELSLKLGRHGAFIGCSRYPDCRFTRPFSADAEADDGGIGPDGLELGAHPELGTMITLRSGRFGPYVQLGEALDGEKPKRSSLPKGWEPASITLEKAVMLINLPREVGLHPEDGEPILANLGRYGPYVQHLKTYANLQTMEEVFDIGLNRAVSVIADKRANPGRGRTAAKPLKELGNHTDGEPIHVFEGRYGPYVKHGKTNATLPKDVTPDTVTLERAIELIDARVAKGPAKKKKRKAPAKKKKAPAKKK